MIGIKVNNRFLDLPPGLNTEVERKSPLFAFNDVTSEASTPITIKYTENNALALDLPYQFYSVRKKKKFAAQLYDGERFFCLCTLVIETGALNINNISNTNINGYVLFGISEFYQQVKGKRLTTLTLGGVRTFNWTTSVPGDASDGFWQHLHATWTNDTIPYLFAPIRNEAYNGEAVEIINALGANANLNYAPLTNPIVPQIRIKYLYEQIMSEYGWRLDATALDGSDWEKLVLVSLKSIDFFTISLLGVAEPKPVITFSLADFLPPEKEIGNFIIELHMRYGWAPVFDLTTKTCRIVPVKDAAITGTLKDWTAFANPNFNSDFSADAKVFSFANDIDSEDALPSNPGSRKAFSIIKIKSEKNLAAASEAYSGKLVYCWLENKYFKAVDEGVPGWQWQLFGDNIYNEEPAGTTDVIETTISTLPIQLTLDRTSGGYDFYRVYPMMQQDKFSAFGYRTLIYHGLVLELKGDDLEPGDWEYPFLSSTRHHPNAVAASQWSNVYNHWDDVANLGIIPFWWSRFLAMIKEGESVECRIYLPLPDLLNFVWDDIIQIYNVRFLVVSMIMPMGYKGFVQATLFRTKNINATEIVDETEEDMGGINTGTIYARLTAENLNDEPADANYTAQQSQDVVVRFYSDMAGTIPYNLLTSVDVLIQKNQFNPAQYNSENLSPITIIANEQIALQHVFANGTGSVSNPGTFTDEYTLLNDPAYTVIV